MNPGADFLSNKVKNCNGAILDGVGVTITIKGKGTFQIYIDRKNMRVSQVSTNLKRFFYIQGIFKQLELFNYFIKGKIPQMGFNYKGPYFYPVIGTGIGIPHFSIILDIIRKKIIIVKIFLRKTAVMMYYYIKKGFRVFSNQKHQDKSSHENFI